MPISFNIFAGRTVVYRSKALAEVGLRVETRLYGDVKDRVVCLGQ